MSDAQFAEDLFPEETKEQGFADELFPVSVDVENVRQKLGGGPIQDLLFSNEKFSVARVLKSFGRGAKEGWGEETGLSKDNVKKLKEAGWFNDYEKGQADISKAVTEGLFHSAAVVFQGLSAGLKGVGETVADNAQDAFFSVSGVPDGHFKKNPKLGRDLAAALTEAFPHARPIRGTTGLPTLAPTAAETAAAAGKAVSNANATFAGAADPARQAEAFATVRENLALSQAPTPGELLLARARAAGVISDDQPFVGPRLQNEGLPLEIQTQGGAGGVVVPGADINTVARDIAPDTFKRYDEAQATRETIGAQIAELDEIKAATPARAAEIDELKAKLQERAKEAETEAGELAPAVKEAYAEARKAAPDDAAPAVEPPAQIPGRPIEEQRAFIQNDVKEKLIAAGRPEAEAELAAALDAQYWETRAARFGGAKGSAEDMYKAEGPEIVGAGIVRRSAPKRDEDKFSLFEFLARNGGLKPAPDLRVILDGNPFVPGFGRLIRKDGMSLDKAREAATERGYILGEATGGKSTLINDLLDLIDAEARGNRQYLGDREAGVSALDKERNRHYIERAIDAHIEETGARPDEKLRAHAIRIMEKEGGDAVDALEMAAMRDARGKKAITVTQKDGAEQSVDEFFQEGDIQRGRIRIRDEGRNTITLLKDANASTFLHEKGHDYLSRLIKDADDPLAPASLLADAETTLKWLGVEKADDIKRKHHEKFARGFENYIMEGRAPSHALARVFEQFRQWLLRIYQEASRLKAPINDNIRGVFDRMLAVEPEQVVIAPDRAMAVRHEATAEVAPASVAGDAASAVRSERDIMTGQLTPEQQDARLAEIRAGLGRYPPRGAEPDGNVAAPEPVPAGAGTTQEPGTVSTGGSPVAAPAPDVAAPPASKPVAPHDSFGPHTDAVDKAGNIRLDLLNAPDDIKRVISQVAEENEGFQSVRGPVSDVQVAELAEAMGIDATYLATRKMGEAWTAPQIVALRNLLIQSAGEVRDLMKKAASGDEAALQAYAEAKARHIMIQERVSSVTSEAGRALRAFRKNFSKGMEDAQSLGDFLKKETGQTLYQLQREAQLGASLETPAQVSKFIHDSKKATFPQMIMEFWINAILSGTGTQILSLVSNTMAIAMGLAESGLAGGIGKIRGTDGVRLGEARAEFFGALQGAKDGMRAAVHAFRREELYNRARTVEQEKYQAIPSKRIVVKKYEPGTPEYDKRIETAAKATAHAEKLTGEKFDARVNELKAKPTEPMLADAKERVVEIGGKQVRIPGRLLGAQDELFKTIAYRQKLNGLAFRKASEEGLSGDALSRRVAQLTNDPPEDMMKAASAFGDYQTFTNALGRTGASIAAFSNSHVLAKGIIPFVRSPINSLKYANERTPLGAFSREVRANLKGVNGKAAQDTQIARMAIGSAVATAVFYMAFEDAVTGGGPSSPEERATLMLSGWRPYSFKIGEHYYSYARLEPISTIVGVAAEIVDVLKRDPGTDEEEVSKIAAHYIAVVMGDLFPAVAKSVMSKASLQGVSDLTNAVTDPKRYGPRFMQNRVSSFVPTISAQQARDFDEHAREIRTMLDAIKARVPGLRSDLLPKRDIWGEPIKSDDKLGIDAISLVPMAKISKDPATLALIDAGFFPSKLDRKILGVELTDQQYDDFARIAGRLAKVRVDAIVSSPGFETVSAELRSKVLKKAIDDSRDDARGLIKLQNPDILKQALENKLSAIGAN
jgi:hypothetical protein